MQITTKLSCGDKCFAINLHTGNLHTINLHTINLHTDNLHTDNLHTDNVQELTVGQVRVEFTHSPGSSSYTGSSYDRTPDNYAPKPATYVEQYMCIETGIGSGSIYTLGESLFATYEEALAACEKTRKRVAEEKAEQEARNHEYNMLEAATLRRKLDSLAKKGY